MRLPALATICVLLGSRSGSAQSSEWLLSASRADRIVLGMTVDQLYAAYGRDNVKLVDLYGEGMFTPALQVFKPSDRGAPFAVALINQICGNFRVTGFTAYSPMLRTVDGLGVGSTVAEVRKRFPSAELNREEGPSLILEKVQMTFAIANGSFADSTRVVHVWTAAPLPDSISQCRP
jgi:hypothetical protein